MLSIFNLLLGFKNALQKVEIGMNAILIIISGLAFIGSLVSALISCIRMGYCSNGRVYVKLFINRLISFSFTYCYFYFLFQAKIFQICCTCLIDKFKAENTFKSKKTDA